MDKDMKCAVALNVHLIIEIAVDILGDEKGA